MCERQCATATRFCQGKFDLDRPQLLASPPCCMHGVPPSESSKRQTSFPASNSYLLTSTPSTPLQNFSIPQQRVSVPLSTSQHLPEPPSTPSTSQHLPTAPPTSSQHQSWTYSSHELCVTFPGAYPSPEPGTVSHFT